MNAVGKTAVDQLYRSRLRPARYRDLLPVLSSYRIILVTGPQRSGTTFAATAIAEDTDRIAIREEQFGFTGIRKLLWIMSCMYLARLSCTIQCPAVFHNIGKLRLFPSTAVILMYRDPQEIRASYGHSYHRSGQRLCYEDSNALELSRLGFAEGDAITLKYDLWIDRYHSLSNMFVLDYHSLCEHPLWVEPSVRRSLGPAWHNRRVR